MSCPGIPPLHYLVPGKEKQKKIPQVIHSYVAFSGGTSALQVLFISPTLSAFGSYGS